MTKELKALLIALIVMIPLQGMCFPGKIVKKHKTPGVIPTGLTYDGSSLWLADRKAKKLFSMNPETGKVIKEINSPAYWPMGLAWDGKHLWGVDVKGGIPLSENYNGKIYKIDPKDGTILHTVNAPTSSPRGLTWDGKYLWCADERADKIIQFSPYDGTTIKSFKAPANDPRGITFDGQYLWISDRSKDEIYMVSPEDGSVIIIMDAPGKFTRGLTVAGEYLWAADSQNDEIYQLIMRDDQKIKRSNPHKSKVTYTHQITNYGPGNVQEANVHIAIPRNRPNQEIHGNIDYIPEYTDVVPDQWDQKTAHYHRENIEPNETERFEMKVNCTTYDTRYFIFPDKVGSFEEIPRKIKDKYLANNEKYQLNHPVIQDALEKAIKKKDNPYWVARDIFNHIIDNMYYEMVGGWNTAPAVLARGNGSCSEYTFVYISMCRAAGIPARYVGSVVIRGDYASMDDVFHRWVEIYLPNYGWVPVDPSGGDQKLPRDQANYIGHLSNRFLITTQSGGGSKTMEWTYNSNESWVTDPKTYVVSDNFADWEPAD
jgi:transglutaminase-like putative cysteine protease